jgi:hypothetical protein
MKYDFSSANDLKLRMKKRRDITKLMLQINFTRVEMAKSESLKRNILGYILDIEVRVSIQQRLDYFQLYFICDVFSV